MCARLREHTRELHDATRDETLQILTDMQVKWLFVIADQVRGSDKVDTKDRLIDNLRGRVKELDALLAHSRFRLGKSQRDAALLSDDVDRRDKLIKGMAKAEENAGAD